MKNKFLLAGVLTCLCFGAVAQTTDTDNQRTSFGITAGVNWNNINGKSAAGADLENSLKPGFNGGINVELPLGTGMFLQPGVEYRSKGTEWADGNKLTLAYLDVPVNLLFKPSLGSSNILIGFGPYVGFGLSGKVEYPNGNEADVVFTDDYNSSQAADVQYKKLDMGANVLAGVELSNRFSIMAKAQLGLKDINPNSNISNDETRYRNTGFGLSAGFRF